MTQPHSLDDPAGRQLLAAKRINFGSMPIWPQLIFIVVVAFLGGLTGLALRRNGPPSAASSPPRSAPAAPKPGGCSPRSTAASPGCRSTGRKPTTGDGVFGTRSTARRVGGAGAAHGNSPSRPKMCGNFVVEAPKSD